MEERGALNVAGWGSLQLLISLVKITHALEIHHIKLRRIRYKTLSDAQYPRTFKVFRLDG